MLDDLALFVSIVDLGSLQAAARHANLPPATLTRRLQKLETALGCQLLLRSARSLKPTQEGQLYYEQCRPLLTALAQTTATLDDDLNQVKGTLRVLAPLNLSRGLLAPAYASFMATWPEIRLELLLSNRNEDVWRHGADLAIRVGQQDDPKLRQRRLGVIGMVLVASPAYVAEHGAPTHPHELQQHQLLVSSPLSTWRFTSPDGEETIELQPHGRCDLNDIELGVTLALRRCEHPSDLELARAAGITYVQGSILPGAEPEPEAAPAPLVVPMAQAPLVQQQQSAAGLSLTQ